MVSPRPIEYFFSYYLTIRRCPKLRRLKFDNQREFNASGIRGYRMCYELDGPYERFLEDSVVHCSRGPSLPYYVIWNYVVDHFNELSPTFDLLFRCRMYWFKDEKTRQLSVISKDAEFDFYSQLAEEINNDIQLEPANEFNINELSNELDKDMKLIVKNINDIPTPVNSRNNGCLYSHTYIII